MKYLVLDTNVYLHYKDFEQIDWKSLLGDDVTICVPQVVLREIDKHKDQSRGRVQKRAKRISSRFSEVFLQGESARIRVEEMSNPPVSAYDDAQYHKDINDDWIVLSALYSHHSDSEIVIVSGDNGVLLKAKHHGLGFYKMPDSLLLAEEPSDEEKEIIKLRHELARYENRQPKPIVEFENRDSVLTIIKPSFLDIQKELASYEIELKASNPYQLISDEPESSLDRQFAPTYSTVHQKEEYNKELDDYFKKKLTLKNIQLGKNLLEQRFVKMVFWLCNLGTAPMGDTAVFISFPEDVPIYDENSKVSLDCEDPSKPVLKNNLSIYSPGVLGFLGRVQKSSKSFVLWDPRKKLDSQELKYSSSRLIHGMRCPLDNDNDVYIDIASCGSFTIKWIVIDSKLIDPVEGELHVVIKESGDK